MKVIVIKATGAKVQFGQTAAETHRILAQAGVTIGKSTVKLIQNGTKQEACGIEVVELQEEKKVKAKRKSMVWELLTQESPELTKLVEAGFKVCGTKIIGGKRFDLIKGEHKFNVNLGKRGVALNDLVNKDRVVFASVNDLVSKLIKL